LTLFNSLLLLLQFPPLIDILITHDKPSMQAPKTYSMRLTNFMIVFRKFIHPFDLASPLDYLHAQSLKNPN
jgi:hypothetical protein